MIGVLPDNPYVGLRPYSSDEALLFFGRGQQIAELLTQLHRTHFLGVFGSSGCGKSSLIRAGLIPRLSAGFLVESRDRWTIVTLTPGDAPLARLASAFGVDDVVIRERGATGLVDRLAARPDYSSLNCLLLVDQFEEIFRADASAEAREDAADFVGILLALAARTDCSIFVVITMRSDFLTDCDAFPGLPEALNRSHYLVPRLTRRERREVVEGPVRLFGQAVTRQLADRVLNDVSDEHDQLPVMQHALLRTWERWGREAVGPLDLAHYLAVGGVKDALSNDAGAALESMAPGDAELARRMFQAMTGTDASHRPVRRWVHLSELERQTGAPRDLLEHILERFREGGRSFVISQQDPATGDVRVTISHESLIRQWGKLREWVEQEREARDHYVRLADMATRHARGEEGLLRDPGLQLALDWRETTRPTAAWASRYRDAFGLVASFLEDSEKQRELERTQEEERQQDQLALAAARGRSEEQSLAAHRLRRYLWVTVVMFIGAVIIAAYAAYWWNRAANEGTIATSGRLGLYAATLTESEPDLALLWSVAAFDLAPVAEAGNGLFKVLLRNSRLNRILRRHEGFVDVVTFAPGGKLLASAGRDGRIILWDPSDGSSDPLPDSNGATAPSIYSLAFNADGTRLAAGQRDGGVISVWNMTTRQVEARVRTNEPLIKVAFAPGGWLVSASGEGNTIVRRDPPAWNERDRIVYDGDRILSVIVSPDGRSVVSGHASGEVWVWDVQTGERRMARKHGRAVSALAFSNMKTDAELLASASDDSIIQVGAPADVKPLTLTHARGAVKAVAISADGTLIVSGGDDKRIRVWERAAPYEPLSTFSGHASFVQSVAFGANNMLASGGYDGMVMLWNADIGTEELRQTVASLPGRAISLASRPDDNALILVSDYSSGTSGQPQVAALTPGSSKPVPVAVAPPERRVLAAAFDGDGALVLSGLQKEKTEDKEQDSLYVWDAGTGRERFKVALEDDSGVRNVALGAGRVAYSITTQGENAVITWELATRRELLRFPTNEISSLAFSPDGRMLAVGRQDFIELWDIDTRTPGGSLRSSVTGTRGSLAFSPDGLRLAAGLFSGQIELWDIATRTPLGLLLNGRSPVASLTFARDGRTLVAGDYDLVDGTIRAWDVDAESWRTRACRVANRALTMAEWSAIMSDQPPSRPVCGDR